MRGGSPAAAGVAAAAFSLTPTFTPTFAGASSADLVLVLVQAVEERAAARRAAEAAAAARDAAKCALQQQLDQVWPPPPSPTPTFTPTFAGASSPDLVGPVARCGKPCSGLSSGGAGGVLCVWGVGSGVHPYLIHRLQEGARGSEGARGRRRNSRCSAAAGGSLCGHSRACRGAFDAVRARDAARAADRPRRRPWWSVAAIRARSLAPRLRRRRCGHGPTLGRGWRLAVRSQQSVPRRIRRSARQRCG
jgi:hypothetical protein